MEHTKKNMLLLMAVLVVSVFPIFGLTYIPEPFPPRPPPPPPEKIAVFFWNTAICSTSSINKYIDYLKVEGYTKFFKFYDSNDFEVDFNEVDAYECSYDTIFFYLAGHGSYDDQSSDSIFFCGPEGDVLKSSEFRQYMNRLETSRKAFLICSCHSGGFVEDFRSAPYLAMSATDNSHDTYFTGTPGESYFSRWFFYYVRVYTYNAEYAFYCAAARYGVGNPQIADYSSYIWFAN